MILVNGVEIDDISVTDRGLGYGDGAFRTLRIQAGRVRSWPRQFSKLEADCAALRIPCPSRKVLSQAVSRAVSAESDCIVKLIVTRGNSARVYAPPPLPIVTWIMLTTPVPPMLQQRQKAGVKLRLCETRLGLQPRLAGIKHLNRLENVLARMEWDDHEIAEGLMLDIENYVIAGTMSNIFWVRGNQLYTPDLSRCGVAGVQRARVLDYARAFGIVINMSRLRLSDLLAAEEVFLTNSVIGVWPVRTFAENNWHPGDLTNTIGQWLQEQDD